MMTKLHLHALALGTLCLGTLCLGACTERRPVVMSDAGVDASDTPPDTSEGDVRYLTMRPRSTECIDIMLGDSVGEALGMARIDSLDDDIPRALCSTDLYRICGTISPVESVLLWEVAEAGFYEFRARGTDVTELAIDIESFPSADRVACRDRSDVSTREEVGIGQVPTDVGWLCNCEYIPPTAGRTWSGTPLRHVAELPAGARVLLTIEASPLTEDSALGVDIRRVENCENGTDDDGDGDVDCRDADCPFSNYGVPSTVCDERALCAMPAPDVDCCSNGTDDDGDGEVDCVDQQCSGTPSCVPEAVCDDGLDDDGDLRVDCADFDCRFSPPCYDVDGPGESTCDDGLDDDADGDIDCDDRDCVYPGSACFGPYEMAFAGECEDGLDNDGDGRIDCADLDCRRDSFTCLDVESNCVDGLDDDLDDAIDCGDADCAGAAACVETVCDDGIDQDGDGRTDCADDDCACYGDCPCL